MRAIMMNLCVSETKTDDIQWKTQVSRQSYFHLNEFHEQNRKQNCTSTKNLKRKYCHVHVYMKQLVMQFTSFMMFSLYLDVVGVFMYTYYVRCMNWLEYIELLIDFNKLNKLGYCVSVYTLLFLRICWRRECFENCYFK